MYRSKIELHNVDCLPFMKQCEDNQFDLAIVEALAPGHESALRI